MINQTERLVVDAFQSRFRISLTKVQESSTKSPDFEVTDSDGRVFVIELKNIEYNQASEATGWVVRTSKNGITEAERPSNSVSRIGVKVYEAYKQLKRFAEPRGIVFLNYDRRVRANHLDEAYRGYQIYSNADWAYKNVAAQRIAEGRLKRVKDFIDFFIWIEFDPMRWFFRFVTGRGESILKQYFEMPDTPSQLA